jgi:hypothetical protein
MGQDAGLPSSGYHRCEPIISITNQTLSCGLFRSENYCVIITTRRIICVNTDALLDDRHKRTEENRKIVHKGLPGLLERAFTGPETDTDFSGYFRNMHPDTIIANHPGSKIIPLDECTRFVVTKETVVNYDYGGDDFWKTRIHRAAGRIEFAMDTYPYQILDNVRLKKILGERFNPPCPGFFGNFFKVFIEEKKFR